MWRTCEESYPSELKSLLLNDNVNKSSTLVPISPTLNNQSLICMGCRVKNTNIFVNSNYQIIVNKNHPIAKLIIKVYYEENLCIGTEQTLSSLRSKYWIPACHGIICSVITSCLYCKRDRSKPVPPFMSDIPEDTLCVDEKPFTNTGVDYLGPYCIVWIGLSTPPPLPLKNITLSFSPSIPHPPPPKKICKLSPLFRQFPTIYWFFLKLIPP